MTDIFCIKCFSDVSLVVSFDPYKMPLTSIERFLKSSDGTQIFAKAIGSHAKPSLVFVHGMSLSSIAFDDLFKDKDLLEKFHLVAYDMRGNGRSGKPETPEGHTSKLYADDFAAVVEAFDLKKPLLVGWSFGATVSTDICTHLGLDSISGIVCVGGMPYAGLEEVGNPLLKELIPSLLSTDDVILSIKSKVAIIDYIFNDPDNVPVSIKWLWLGNAVLQSPLVIKAAFSRVQNTDKLFEAGSQGLPMSLIYGTRDKHINGQAVARCMKPHFKGMEVNEIAGGSHAPFYENKTEFLRALITFADRVLNLES